MRLARVEDELIDKIWTTDRPPQPNTDIHGLKMKFTGICCNTSLDDIFRC